MRCQSRFDARYWMLGASALGRPRGMLWGGRRVHHGEHMYTCGVFILIFGKTNTIMYSLKIKIKKKKERKGKGTRDQIATIHWIIKKAREFQKNIYFCFIDSAKAFDYVDHDKLWKIQEMGIPDHLTCLLRYLYTGQEAPVRTGHGTTGWFQIGKAVHRGRMLSPCLFNLYAEYIM